MVLSKVYHLGETACNATTGIWKTLAHPEIPIKSDVHPRLFGRPRYLTELLRSFSWRHNWKYVPFFRLFFVCALGVPILIHGVLPIPPHAWNAYWDSINARHHMEVGLFHGKAQREEDMKYFALYNPLRKKGEPVVTPVSGGGH